MKNIFLVPTGRPSILLRQDNGNLILSNEIVSASLSGQIGNTNQHIYIISEEKPTKGDAIFSVDGLWEDAVSFVIDEPITDNWKKIIFTNDLLLIKKGVEPIDSKFLEWFIKNPTCESVQTDRFYFGGMSDVFKWRILFPEAKTISYSEQEVFELLQKRESYIDDLTLPYHSELDKWFEENGKK